MCVAACAARAQAAQLTGSGLITIGDLSAFLLYTAYVALSISGVASFWSELLKASAACAQQCR